MSPLILLTIFTTLGNPVPDTNLNPLKAEFLKIERYLKPPPDYVSSDTCFYFAELLILGINQKRKINEISVNDHAPEWLKADVNRIKEEKLINTRRLDSIALKSQLKNCRLIFPINIISGNFPCPKAKAKEHIGSNYYQVLGKNLSGNIIFMDPTNFIWPMDFRYKKNN